MPILLEKRKGFKDRGFNQQIPNSNKGYLKEERVTMIDLTKKKTIQLQRLKNLLRVANAIPRNRVNMRRFRTNSKKTCGTSYCLAGWATQDKWFKKQGFCLELHHSTYVPVFSTPINGSEFLFKDGSLKVFYGREACEIFFGKESYLYLFEPILTNNKQECITRIKNFIQIVSVSRSNHNKEEELN